MKCMKCEVDAEKRNFKKTLEENNKKLCNLFEILFKKYDVEYKSK